jgi:hypothetical protein
MIEARPPPTILPLLDVFPNRATRSAVNQADVEAVAATATEYFRSWFAGDGERMRA